MSERPAPKNNAITRNRMSGSLSFPRSGNSGLAKESWAPAFGGAGESLDRAARIKKGPM
jgi:hypothetical protein